MYVLHLYYISLDIVSECIFDQGLLQKLDRFGNVVDTLQAELGEEEERGEERRGEGVEGEEKGRGGGKGEGEKGGIRKGKRKKGGEGKGRMKRKKVDNIQMRE